MADGPRVTPALRAALLEASKGESDYAGWPPEVHERLVRALDSTPDGTPLPAADLSGVETHKMEMALDDLSFIQLVMDYHGLENLAW